MTVNITSSKVCNFYFYCETCVACAADVQLTRSADRGQWQNVLKLYFLLQPEVNEVTVCQKQMRSKQHLQDLKLNNILPVVDGF